MKLVTRIMPGFVLCLAFVSAPALKAQALINQAAVLAKGGFPYVITQPGSYKLDGNLTVSKTGTDGIQISANDVTLDLNGYTVSGTGKPSSPYAVGIRNPGTSVYTNITVKNGTVRGFDFSLALNGSGLVADMQLTNSQSSFGTSLVGYVIVRCVASSNAGAGLDVNESVVLDSVASSNKADGFIAGYSLMSANTAHGNTGIGIALTGASSAFQNTANGNGFGISSGDSTSAAGSNSMIGNPSGDLSMPTPGRSQNNNLCSTGAC